MGAPPVQNTLSFRGPTAAADTKSVQSKKPHGSSGSSIVKGARRSAESSNGKSAKAKRETEAGKGQNTRTSLKELHDDLAFTGLYSEKSELALYHMPGTYHTADPPPMTQYQFFNFMMQYVPYYGSQMARAVTNPGSKKSNADWDNLAEPFIRAVYEIAKWAQAGNPEIDDNVVEYTLRRFLHAMKGFVMSNFSGSSSNGTGVGMISVDDWINYSSSLDYLRFSHRKISAEEWHTRLCNEAKRSNRSLPGAESAQSELQVWTKVQSSRKINFKS